MSQLFVPQEFRTFPENLTNQKGLQLAKISLNQNCPILKASASKGSADIHQGFYRIAQSKKVNNIWHHLPSKPENLVDAKSDVLGAEKCFFKPKTIPFAASKCTITERSKA